MIRPPSAIMHRHASSGGDDHPTDILTLISASMSASVMDLHRPRAIPALLTENVQARRGPGRGDGILNRLRAGAVGLYRSPQPTQGLYFIGDRMGFIGRFSYVITTSAGARHDSAMARPNLRLAPATSAFLPVKSIRMMTSLRVVSIIIRYRRSGD